VKDFNDSLGNTGDRRTGPLYYSAPRVPAGDVTRSHDFLLPVVRHEFNKKNFILKDLYNYI